MHKYNIKIFVQVRLGSTRLPGKALKKFGNNKPLLGFVLENILKSNSFSKDDIVVLTTDNKVDDKIEEYCKTNQYAVFRGNENNVFERYFSASKQFASDYIVRICADNPFLQPAFIDQLVAEINSDSNWDYLSFEDYNGTPSIKTHYGIFAELIKTDALWSAEKLRLNKIEEEHVTPVFYGRRDFFVCEFLEIPKEIQEMDFRLTIDTEEDFKVAQELMEDINYDSTNFDLLMDKLEDRKDLLTIMHKVIRENKK